jgi:hypothetical protein
MSKPIGQGIWIDPTQTLPKDGEAVLCALQMDFDTPDLDESWAYWVGYLSNGKWVSAHGDYAAPKYYMRIMDPESVVDTIGVSRRVEAAPDGSGRVRMDGMYYGGPALNSIIDELVVVSPCEAGLNLYREADGRNWWVAVLRPTGEAPAPIAPYPLILDFSDARLPGWWNAEWPRQLPARPGDPAQGELDFVVVLEACDAGFAESFRASFFRRNPTLGEDRAKPFGISRCAAQSRGIKIVAV